VATGRRPSMGMRGGNESTASCGYGLRLPTGMREPVLVLPSLAYWDGVHLHRPQEKRIGEAAALASGGWMPPSAVASTSSGAWNLESRIRRLERGAIRRLSQRQKQYRYSSGGSSGDRW